MTHTEQVYIQQTQQWIQSFIISLNLCPFAQREMDKGSVRIEVSSATTNEKALKDLKEEIALLNTNNKIETSFLLFPMFLQDFFDYLDFSYLAEASLLAQGYEGVYQLATFHPNYCFADANVDDVTNYTNRSPYPMLHILREESVEKAIAYFGNTGSIPENNMARLRMIGTDEVEKMVQECLIVK
jgi:uncharacterized protein